MSPRYVLSLKAMGTWFGLGLVPFAPGTFGTLGAIPLVYLFQRLGELPYMFATLLFAIAAIFIAQMYEDVVSTDHDPAEFVLDEVAGFLVTMTWIPFTWAYLLAGFVIFRLLDIVKPFPISWVDKRVPADLARWPMIWWRVFWRALRCSLFFTFSFWRGSEWTSLS